MKTRPIPELIAERRALARDLADINRRLEKLDHELFQRLDTAFTALGMSLGASPATIPAVNVPLPVPSGPTPSIFNPIPPLPREEKKRASATTPRLFTVHHEPSKARQGEVGATILSHVWRYLAQYKRPLKTAEIYDLLMKEGVEIPGKDPRNNLSAHLSRSNSLVRMGNGWWKAPEKQEPPEGGS